MVAKTSVKMKTCRLPLHGPGIKRVQKRGKSGGGEMRLEKRGEGGGRVECLLLYLHVCIFLCACVYLGLERVQRRGRSGGSEMRVD